MKLFETKHLIALLGVLALIVSGCASGGSKPTPQQFEAPETVVEGPDKNLFSQALKAQNEGQFDSAIKLWKSFLSKHPKSFEGHNNLGLVYYTQDMLSQALREFETAYRLNREDDKIRKNLARALRFKASMLHENREYFETLEILARLELIVEPEEKQGILFKQEQVEDQIFLQVIKADNSASYQEFINRFPDGLNAVRAREYLENNPHKAAKKVTSNAKSWISSGKKEDSSSWASAEQPPDYSSTRPSAVYTPPAGGGGTKLGDFFGADAEGMKKVEEKDINAPQEVDPAATIPFEDFEKPERLSGDPAEVTESIGSKENRRDASEPDPMQDEPEAVTASLDTLPDLTPIPVAELPAEMDPPKSADVGPGEIKMQPVEQETETVGLAEPIAEQANEEVKPEEAPEEMQQEEPQPEMAQTETAEPETVESESDRIARIVKEEIANAEAASSDQAQPEPASEAEVESPQEAPMEAARVEPENQEPQPEMAPTETAAEGPSVSPETVSETVAALMPTPPPTEAMETASDSEDSSSSMVVVKMREGATLNVRAEPSIQGEIMGYLENGDMMPFMSESGDWYQIEIEEGLSGWISKRYSTKNETIEMASVPTEPDPESAPVSEEEPTHGEPGPEQEQSSELTPLGAEPKQPLPKDAVVVVTVSEGAILNVRSLPSSNGAIVDMLFRGDKLPLVKEEGDWYQVEFDDETTGWISKKFSIIEGSTLKASLPVPEENKQRPKTRKQKSKAQNSNEMVTTVVVVKVPKGSSLNVRSAPSSQGQVMGSLQSGDMRPLLEEADEWYQVELPDGQSGWISRKFSGKMDVDTSFLKGP